MQVRRNDTLIGSVGGLQPSIYFSMKKILVLLAALGFSAVACLADPVAVFDVQWGKGKERQTRSFAIAFL